MNKNEFIITLLNLPKIGKVTTRKLSDRMYNSNISIHEIADYFKKNSKSDISIVDIEKANIHAKSVIDFCFEHEIKMVNYTEECFPRKLLKLKVPPVLLYYKGNIDRLNTHPSIAIVGSREPSNYGIEIARKYSNFFVEKDFNIISGLAKGIDSIGHDETVKNNGYAVAFIAQGLETPLYPKENRILAQNIIAKSGLVVSEYEPKIEPNRNYFVERDRLQCGASDSVLVIETDIDGGTMHAALGALELGRICATLDHPEKYKQNNPKSRGNQNLITEHGAIPVFGKDSLENLAGMIIFEHKKTEHCLNLDLEIDHDLKKYITEELTNDQLKFDI